MTNPRQWITDERIFTLLIGTKVLMSVLPFLLKIQKDERVEEIITGTVKEIIAGEYEDIPCVTIQCTTVAAKNAIEREVTEYLRIMYDTGGDATTFSIGDETVDAVVFES